MLYKLLKAIKTRTIKKATLAELPKLLEKSEPVRQLPRVIDKSQFISSKIEKTYRYRQMEPLYAPFYLQLRKAFNIQRVVFKKSGIVNKLWKKKAPLSKVYIKKYVQKNLPIDENLVYNILKRNYLKQFNLLKSIMQEDEPLKLTKQQQRALYDVAKGINKTTKDKIANHLYKSLQQGEEARKAKFKINTIFKDMSYYRSERISKTELTRAHNDSIYHSLKSLDVKRKRWVLCGDCSETGSCPMCKGNARKGWIHINTKFPSGHPMPPAHPGCTCGIM